LRKWIYYIKDVWQRSSKQCGYRNNQTMQPLPLKDYKPKKLTRYDLVKEIADRLNERAGKWLKLLEGWEWKDIDEVYRSALALSKDRDMPFAKSFNWHIKEIKKSMSG